MQRKMTAVVFIGLSLIALFGISLAQEIQTDAPRRILKKVTPDYPPLALTVHLGGMVKLEAVVASDGTPKSVEIRGGHPVLAQAAADAIGRWKWEPGRDETHEIVYVKFTPR
ncbi:MAG TPA: energy transducer TonB [Terriglobales bacterium]|nr:energy transducer TonB [Terriglobales bacterium]